MQEKQYSISLQQRYTENLHIVFWLVKDLSWCMEWRFIGVAMILPTFIIALVITWRNRKIMSETCHNLAVTFWIAANAYWMLSEFLKFNEVKIYNDITYKHLAIAPFTIGILILMYYYLWQAPRQKK